MSETDDLSQFQDWAPYYVNGRLPPEQAAWMDHYLADHPEARTELDFWQNVEASLQAEAEAIDPEFGLAAARRLIAQSQSKAAPKPARRSLWQQLNEVLSPIFAPAYSMAMVVALAGVIVWQHQSLGPKPEDELGQVRSGAAHQVTGPVLRIAFKPETTEATLRGLLTGIQGRLVGGPGEFGFYLVAVPQDTLDQAAATLKQHPAVTSVETLPDIPPEAKP